MKKILLTSLLSLTLLSCTNNKDTFTFEGFKEIETQDIAEIFSEQDMLGTYTYTTTKYTQDSAYFELNEDNTFILHLQGLSTGNWSFNEDKTKINISNLDLCSFIENNIDGNEDLIPTYIDFDLTYGIMSLTVDSFEYVFKPRKLQVLYGAYKFYYSLEDYSYTFDHNIKEYITLEENNVATLHLAKLKDDSYVDYEEVTYNGTWSINNTIIVINYNDTTIEYSISSSNELIYQVESDTQYILKKE